MPKEVCRFCLGPPVVSCSLLERKILHMIESLALSKVSRNDNISTIICLKCVLSVKLAYRFKQKVAESELKLLSQTQVKKEEIQEPQIDLVQLCDSCCICGVCVDPPCINDHIRTHFKESQACEICNENFTDFQLYKEHSFKHKTEVYNCEKCNAKFRYKTFFDSHCNKLHSNSKEAIDERIKVLGLKSKKSIKVLTKTASSNELKFPSDVNVDDETAETVVKLGIKSSEAIKSLMEKTGKRSQRRTCNICLKSFTKKSFSVHSHETKTCNICNKEILKYSYRLHMENHTSGSQVCHLCGVTLQNKNNLRNHMFYVHSQLRYKCDECGKAFQKKSVRDMHVQKAHIGKPTLVCETCGKGFYNQKSINKHVRMTHLKLRPHICEFCKKGFSTPYALKTHRRQHTNETPYRCEVCGEGFRQNVSLRAHRKSKHDIVEETVCHCDVCGKGFSSDFALFSHKRLH